MSRLCYSYFGIRGLGVFASFLRLFYFLVQVLRIELSNQSKFRFSLRRAVIFSILVIFIPCLVLWNHIGLSLDDIFFCNWKSQEIVAPLFLVGNARSGTTWLQRLITRESSGFVTFKTWELIFAVSITWRWLFHTLFYIDAQYYSGIAFKTLMWLEATLLGVRVGESRDSQVHPLGLMEAEEDEWLMVHVAYSQLILFFFPQGGEVIHKIIMFDYCEENAQTSGKDAEVLLNISVRREIFLYYKQCVQRHLYYYSHFSKAGEYCSTRPPVVFVSKNPAFTLRIPSILEAFPDARIVCLLRDPMQSIPSMISYISKVWHAFADPVDKYPSAKELLGFCAAHYLFPLLHLKCSETDIKEKRATFVSYHKLLSQLSLTVTNVLDSLYGARWTNKINFVQFRQYLDSEQTKAGDESISY